MSRPVHRLIAIAVAILILGSASPVPSASAAGLPAPRLTGPVGGTAPGALVELGWQRVPGAADYVVRVRHASQGGRVHLETVTVNDRLVATVNFAGDVAWWSVAARNGHGLEGTAASATFTTARITPQLQWPPDGATIRHPDAWPELRATTTLDQPESLRATQGPGSGVPVENAPTRFALGAWRWGVRSDRNPCCDPISPSPTSAARTFTVAWPDGVPELSAPADGAELAPGQPLRLRWDPVPGAVSYHWEIGAPVATANVRLGQTTATWVDIETDFFPDDIAGGTWDWRVRAVMAGTEDLPNHPGSPVFGPWSGPSTFTLPGAPGTPGPVAPADGATLSAWPVLHWDPVPGTRGYVVEINDTPSPPDPFDRQAARDGWFSFDPPGDPDDPGAAASGTATRYWRVAASGTLYDADMGPWSAWRSFTVEAAETPLAAETQATILGPADCASNACDDLEGRPLLTWSPVAGAASYRVFVRWAGGSGSADEWFDTASTGLVLPVDRTEDADRVAWAVLACPASGCSETMPASRRQFRVTFAAPVLAGPADGTVQQISDVEMAWSLPQPAPGDLVARPSTAEVSYDVTPGEHGPQDHWGNWTSFSQWTHFGVRDGSSLAWRVRAYEEYGHDIASRQFGAWSPLRTITRTTPPIELLSPAEGDVVTGTPVLDWSEQAYPVRQYRVEVARVSTIANMGGNAWDWAALTGATSIHPPALGPGDYSWRVSDGDDWTTGTFTIAGADTAPQPSTPADGATVRADDAFFSWAPWTSTSWFGHPYVQVSTTTGFAEEDRVLAMTTERTATSLAVPSLLPTGILYWRVCFSWDCGPSRTIVVAAAPGPDVTDPAVTAVVAAPIVNGRLGTNRAIPVRIRWTATDVGSGIGSQQVQVRRGSGPWTSLAVTSSARSVAASFVPDATFAIRVRATDKAGNTGPWVERSIEALVRQESSSLLSWSGPWYRSSSSAAAAGATRWSTRRGATASFTVRASSIAIVAPRSAARGSARVSIDGAYVATVKLSGSPNGARRIVHVASWPSAGRHRVTVQVLGTIGRPRFDVDALVVLR